MGFLWLAALTLRVKRVERQRTLARPAHTGEHDEPVAGEFDVDALKVMLAGAANDDAVFHQERSKPRSEFEAKPLVYRCRK